MGKKLILLLVCLILVGCKEDSDANAGQQTVGVSEEKASRYIASVKSETTKQKCSEFYRVKLGDRYFMLPRGVNKYLKKDGKMVPKLNGKTHFPCTQKPNEYIDTDTFFFHPPIPEYSTGGRRDGAGFVIRVDAFDILPQAKYQKENLSTDTVKKRYVPEGVNIEDLPVEEGFYVYKYPNIPRYKYIEKKQDMDDAVVYSCIKAVVSDSDQSLDCETTIKSDTGITYFLRSIHTGWIPVKDFHKFRQLFLNYMDSLDVTDEYEATNNSTN